MRLKPEAYAEHIMEPVDPKFAQKIEHGDIIVAETNFGIGSSREHAAIGLKKAGIGAVVAKSFGRIFYRNAINQGLPAVRANTDVIDALDEGDKVELDIFGGTIQNQSTGEAFDIEEPDGLLREILSAGGAKAYYGDK